MKIELSRDDFALLLLALGCATGVKAAQGDLEMAQRLIQLTNEVNKNNPNWSPYQCNPTA